MAHRYTVSAAVKQSIGVAALCAASLTAGNAQEVTLELSVSGVTEIIGNLAVAAFDSQEKFDSRTDPVAQALQPVTEESMRLTIALPAPGDYAIIVYQDLNLSGAIDMTRFGLPTEPYGFSNNPRSVFGPPGFRKSRISLSQGFNVHAIRLR